MTITGHIKSRIEAIPAGEPFSTMAFLGDGTRTAVDQALFRLVKSGKIRRLARGVFVRPKCNRFVGDVPPSAFKVAQAMAEMTGAVIDVHGAEALRRFGLSIQVPVQPVFYTSGPSRRFKLGETEVVLKHIAPRKLALAGRPAGLALRALWYLGAEKVTPRVIQTISLKLEPEEWTALNKARSMMPAWMADAFVLFGEGWADG